MSRFLIGESVDPKSELKALLDSNAMRYSEEADGSVRLLFRQDGCKWEAIFRFTERSVLVYGIYPFRAPGKAADLERINARLLRGALFRHEGALVMRTSADLFDAYSAYEAIARAVEYNAGAMVSFWPELALLSADTG